MYVVKEEEPTWMKHRGVDQRNTALQWLRENYSPGDIHGIVYFADDDNTYSLRLFEEVCKRKKKEGEAGESEMRES